MMENMVNILNVSSFVYWVPLVLVSTLTFGIGSINQDKYEQYLTIINNFRSERDIYKRRYP